MSLTPRLRRAPSGDLGAVAVIVAICMVMLFAAGALVVDLGNGWSRRRMAQTDADMAALAGAAQLPDQGQARQAAYDFLKRNLPRSDNGADAGPMGNYSNGSLDDGEIVFPSSTKITVYVPQRKVSFGLANAIGFSATNVTAQATAQIRSPKLALPFFLNSMCNVGSQVIKTPPPGQAEPTPVWPSPVATGNNAPALDPTLTFAPQTSLQEGAIPVGETMAAAGKHLTGASQVLFIRGSTPQAATSLTVTGDTQLTAGVPTTLTAGTWYVAVKTAAGWNKPSQAPSFSVAAAAVVACGQSSTGDFGLIDSPRLDVSSSSTSIALDLNLSNGLDHTIQCYPYTPNSPCPVDGAQTYILPAPTSQNCQVTPQTPIPGGVYDNDPTQPFANCVDINNGLGPAATTQGLITGGTDAGKQFIGRLTSDTTSTCPAPVGTSNPTSLLGENINNDQLSCYLVAGHSLSDLAKNNPPDNILDVKIFDSPRFFFVPVLNSEVLPQNGFYPVIDWRGVFITDETQFSNGTSTTPGNATPANGIVTTNTKITQLTVFAFKLNALPSTGLPDNGGTIPYLGGGIKIPVLVD